MTGNKCSDICAAIKDEESGAEFYRGMLPNASKLESNTICEIIEDEVRHKDVLKLMSDDNNCKCI